MLTYGRVKGAKPTLEMRGYKAMFATISAIHQQEYKNLCIRVDLALTNLKLLQNITAEMQETLRVLKNNVLSQLFIVHTYQRVLRELLKNDEDLSLMNLTLLKTHPTFYRKPLAPEILVASDDTSVGKLVLYSSPVCFSTQSRCIVILACSSFSVLSTFYYMLTINFVSSWLCILFDSVLF